MVHWVVEANQLTHDHERFCECYSASARPSYWVAERQQISNYCRSSLALMCIVASMRDSDVTITPRDVYNIRDAERWHLLHSSTPPTALLDGLESASLCAPYYTQFDVERRLTPPFIISSAAKEICCIFSAGKSGCWTLLRNQTVLYFLLCTWRG